jgi:hypothetical protein
MADETTTEAVEGAEATEAAEETQGTDTEGQADKAELDRIRAALAKANKEAEKLRLREKEREDAQLSEIEKAKRDADDASQRLARYERDNLLKTVALNEGVPAKWVGRLQGDTEEELVADARSILADLGKPRKPEPDASQGARQNAVVSGWDKGRAEALKRFGNK